MRPELKSAIDMALRLAQATPEETATIRAALVAPTAPAADKLLTSKAASSELDCCVATLFRYEAAGKLHAIRRSQRSIRWRLSEIRKLKMDGAA